MLHTRVSALLEQELKRLAASLRVPVSNVVRGMLEEAVATLDQVEQKAEGELRSAADRLGRHREELRGTSRERVEPNATARPEEQPTPVTDDSGTAPLRGVIGFQPLLLARPERCALCGIDLAIGAKAYLGIHESGTRRVIIGKECLPMSAASHEED